MMRLSESFVLSDLLYRAAEVETKSGQNVVLPTTHDVRTPQELKVKASIFTDVESKICPIWRFLAKK